ncbi:hypothetical protein LTR78_000872 [Recurvomyces mirabilis]|uniref:Xylanolytic transcriptional activator regulatory domain-containing protein n=1 Tax=Recurvomyces mirabilis TaxID=574656 RepID=A0AAE0WWW6_9PEZI|nr:hypothetical protein LTR78_000872 [Recurvomyces mirabilis]KAK5158842.1 hypothetical protein LTS14_002950 [Recurvomyces mirabilis]
MKAEVMREKVDRLESFVNQLRQTDTGKDESAVEHKDDTAAIAQPATDLAHTVGRLKVTDAGVVHFVGPSHWEAIIDDITEVKTYFEEQGREEQSPPDDIWQIPQSSIAVADIILRITQLYSLEDLLHLVPPKYTMDRLVVLWFHCDDALRLLTHPPTFQAEYEKFWRDPGAVSPAWLALLLAIASVGAEMSNQATDDPVMQSMAEDLRRMTAHALLIADYVRPQAHAIEALLLHIKSLLLKNNDVTSETYILLGCVTRLCTQGGYHRDPRHNPEISPVQAEMRRRVWGAICAYDIKMCYQLGLVSVINCTTHDTAEPLNYTDADLTADPLPPPRPWSEVTPVTYCLAYHHISTIFGDIIMSTHAAQIPEPGEIETLCHRLLQARDSLPSGMKMKALDQSICDPTELRTGRYTLEFAHLKAVCVLYQRYIGLEGYEEEQRRCIHAAKELIQHQLVLLNAAQPGNNLTVTRAFLVQFIHDFNLAAMILCSVLKSRQATGSPPTVDQGLEYALPEMLELCVLWESYSTKSMKARHALRAIHRFLKQNVLGLTDPIPNGRVNAAGSNGTERNFENKGTYMNDNLQKVTQQLGMLSPGQGMMDPLTPYLPANFLETDQNQMMRELFGADYANYADQPGIWP